MSPRDAPMVRRRVLVSGRVQGVFFRDSCRQEAQRHAVAGSADNLPDGRVEVILEGEATSVEDMIEWCRNGPRHADVDDVEVLEEAPEGLKGFRTG
jgi:acylphosphatase